jgi:hypothetical protein
MAREPRKEIKVERSKTTGWWTWEANWYDENGEWMCGTGGHGSSKSDAKRQRKNAECPCCDSSKLAAKIENVKKIFIEPPLVDAEVVNGYLCNFSMYNPEGEKIKFSTSEISDNTAYWIFGLDCFEPNLSERSELVIAMLKIWGVYRRGKDKKAIMEIHNLTEEYFDIIADKSWSNINIKFDEEDNMYWDIIV